MEYTKEDIIKALENTIRIIEEMEKWVKPCYTCKYRPDKVGNDYWCAFDCDNSYRGYEKGE